MASLFSDRLALAAVVTEGVLEEFELLKFSFELFHGPDHHWFVRCDEMAADHLSRYPNFHCKTKLDGQKERAHLDSAEYTVIGGQKMQAIGDAWNEKTWEAVMYLDADLVISSAFAEAALDSSGEVVLTPHYYSPRREDWVAKYGYFNAGFALAKTAKFHRWWSSAFASQVAKFSDQQCLDDAPKHFTVGVLGEQANISFWRGAPPLELPAIPQDCMFVHAHMFQPALAAPELIAKAFKNELSAALGQAKVQAPFGAYELLHKAFALHFLAFLKNSSLTDHGILYREIVSRDRLGIYGSILDGIGR